MSDRRVFVVTQPDHDSENIDSIWLTEQEALDRSDQIGKCFLTEYRIGHPDAWVRNGWAPVGDPPAWSDWGQPRPVLDRHTVDEPRFVRADDDRQDGIIAAIERRASMDYGAALPTDAEPHAFVGRVDRWCEICDLPDRHPVHAALDRQEQR